LKSSYKFYRFCYRIVRPIFGIFYWLKIIGRENIPPGAAMICANHSSLLDPFLIAFAFGIDHQTHIVGKKEVFRIPVISPLLRKLGMISVDRDITDVSTIKGVLGYLKKDEKVAIFPEGTRTRQDGEVTPKIGAVKIAEHAEVQIIPVYIPRKKRMFKTIQIVIGEPYGIARQKGKRTVEEYAQLAGAVMCKITALGPQVRQPT
jgi:1-acyl-sn-glycerol-3-phosphate acyltransferase